MMDCREATRLLSEAQDRELGLRERLVLRVHVAMCAACRRFGTQVRELRVIARSYVQKGDDDDGDRDGEG